MGAGFTGFRVANLLRRAGYQVICTRRTAEYGSRPFDAATGDFSPILALVTADTAVLYSIPLLRLDGTFADVTPTLVGALRHNPPCHFVYLSTTGVYGATESVDEHTTPAPVTARECLRIAAEASVQNGPWSSLILRPAAIYGPGRGIPASLRTGTYRLPENASNFVSRIHVDDLAALAAAALLSDQQGAFPVADDEPCSSWDAARFCAELLGVPVPDAVSGGQQGETRRANRRVDGSAIRNLLHVPLRYPSYRTGFPACLEAELRERSMS